MDVPIPPGGRFDEWVEPSPDLGGDIDDGQSLEVSVSYPSPIPRPRWL
jgi:hypothetical protein